MRGLLLVAVSLLLLVSPAFAVNFAFDWPQTNADGSNLTDLAGGRVYTCAATPCTKATAGAAKQTIPAPAADPAAGAIATFSLTSGKGFLFATAFDTSGNESAESNVLPFKAVAPESPTLRQVP